MVYNIFVLFVFFLLYLYYKGGYRKEKYINAIFFMMWEYLLSNITRQKIIQYIMKISTIISSTGNPCIHS